MKSRHMLLIVVCTLCWSPSLRAEVDEATAKRAREIIAGIEAATKSIVDISCTIEVSQGGGISREYYENQLRK